MSLDDFISKEYSENTRPYPSHLKYFDSVKEIWHQNPDIDHWITNGFLLLEKRD